MTRALVVDDDPIMRSLLRSRLALFVDEVVEAGDGLEAWRLLSGTKFHLALVDLMMPGLNGFALLQCMRGHKRTRHMPIVVITSNDDRQSIQSALEAGASSFLTKPVMWSTFRPHVEYLLRLSVAAETAEAGLARQMTLSDVQGQLFAAMAALSRATARRLASLAGQVASGEARLCAIVEAAADAGRQSARLSGVRDMIGSRDLIDTAVHDLDALMRDAQLNVTAALAARDVSVATGSFTGLALTCGREAMLHAVAAILGIVAGRALPGALIEIADEPDSDWFSLLFGIGAGQWTGLEPEERGADLALAAHRSLDGVALEVALVRTLLAAHGGTLELVEDADLRPGLRIRLPADRMHRAEPATGDPSSPARSLSLARV